MTAVPGEAALVLHTRPWRDTSALVDFFTADSGRIRCVVRGARRKGRGGGGSAILQPFIPLWVAWRGRSELKTATAFEAAGPALPLAGLGLLSGLYLNELLMRLLQSEDPHPQLHAAYRHSLEALIDNATPDIVLRRFELHLLEQLGWGIALDTEAETGAPLAPDRWYRHHPESGLVAARRSDADTYPGDALLALAAGDFSPRARAVARALCRRLLDERLGPKPLKSRELLVKPR